MKEKRYFMVSGEAWLGRVAARLSDDSWMKRCDTQMKRWRDTELKRCRRAEAANLRPYASRRGTLSARGATLRDDSRLSSCHYADYRRRLAEALVRHGAV